MRDSGPCSSQGPSSAPHSSHHSPLEGESQQPSRQATAAAVGGRRHLRLSWAVGCSRRFRCSPHRRDFGLAPSSCRLPLKGGVMRGNGGLGFIGWMPAGGLPSPRPSCHSGESRNPAQIERGTRTFARWRRQAAARVYGCPPRPRSALKEREARALYAGFPPARDWRGGAQEWRSRLYSLDAHRVFTRPAAREWRGGHGNGGVGFIRWMPIGFLHGLESRNPWQI